MHTLPWLLAMLGSTALLATLWWIELRRDERRPR